MSGRTYIDDLPTLDDLEQNNNGPESEMKYQKFIRNNHPPDPMSGMYSMHAEAYGPPSGNSNHATAMPQNESRNMVQSQPSNSFNCVDVSNHVENCPVCTKLYGNKDRTIFIITIVLLAVVCILLMKKVLNL